MGEGGPRLALGTAQWGMDYGIANVGGQPTLDELRRMLSAALEHGIDVIDTASAYGTSEKRIGGALRSSGTAAHFRLITKLPPNLVDQRKEYAHEDPENDVVSAFEASQQALLPGEIDTLLVHRGWHRTALDGRLWSALRRLRESGRVKRIGVSASNPYEAWSAVHDPSVDAVQVAANLLDQRLARSGFFVRAAEMAKEVHVRSIYLQGLAFLEPRRLEGHMSPARSALLEVARFAAHHNLEPADIWLDHARTLTASHLVIGVESAQQVLNNVGRFARTPNLEVAAFAEQLELLPESILDPSLWKRS